MKKVYKHKGNIVTLNASIPTPGDREILVAVRASVISTGTETMDMRKDELSLIQKFERRVEQIKKVKQKIDQNGWKATLESVKRKLDPEEQNLVFKPLGYSNAGVVVAKGRLVSEFNVGDSVACAGAGLASHAEYSTIPVNLAAKFNENVEFKHAAFTTIGAIAMQGVRRANVSFGETIVITGLGLIGLLAVQIAKAWGLRVIGIDVNASRLELAKAIGAEFCFHATDPLLYAEIDKITSGFGVDAVLIYAATQSSEPLNQAFKLCRMKGKVVAVGAFGMDIKRDEMYTKELDLLMSTSYGPGRYDNNYEIKGIDYPIGYVRWTENRNMQEFLRLISQKLIKLDLLIGDTYSIDQAAEAYNNLITNPEKNISSVFLYDVPVDDVFKHSLVSNTNAPKISQGKIGVGFIGVGSFIQKNHLPNILRYPEYFEVVAMANRTPEECKYVAEKYKPRYVTTDYHELLEDPEINLVVIGTRHNLHARQTLEAIQAGKHVLVEKPLALSWSDLDEVEKAYIKSSGDFIASVGFNRRYSPFTQKLLGLLKPDRAIVVNYRINAGHIPNSVWIQNMEEGGGRILGEVCHFVDYISYITQSSLKNIASFAIPVSDASAIAEDNLVISLQYVNGSIGVITYTAIGGKSMNKEYIEVFQDGNSIVIDDFVSMKMFSNDIQEIKMNEKSKGHEELILELGKLLKGEDSLIKPFQRDIESTKATMEILDIIHGKQQK
jgi:predicted dehydrogenase/threonine dehydrogenase-like Zn-dependent dehydrogenase